MADLIQKDFDNAKDYRDRFRFCPFCGIEMKSIFNKYMPVKDKNALVRELDIWVCRKCYGDKSKTITEKIKEMH